MVTGSEGQLHNHASANRDPTFVKCLGTRDVAMHAGASPHGCRRASCRKCHGTVMVIIHGAETRLLKMSILMVSFLHNIYKNVI